MLLESLYRYWYTHFYMKIMKKRFCWTIIVLFVLSGVWVRAEEYSWQKKQAKISSTGDIEWSPQPFAFEKGDSVRYIDFEGGGDSNDALTRGTAWKHPP